MSVRGDCSDSWDLILLEVWDLGQYANVALYYESPDSAGLPIDDFWQFRKYFYFWYTAQPKPPMLSAYLVCIWNE